jgi:secondary thiamine-phosphate synthase enzyme
VQLGRQSFGSSSFVDLRARGVDEMAAVADKPAATLCSGANMGIAVKRGDDIRMRQFADLLRVTTKGRGPIEFTHEAVDWVSQREIKTGLLTLFCRHTSASLMIQENASPDVRADLESFFEKIAPEGNEYEHRDEGADDMPAHIRAVLTGIQLTIPLMNGRLALGTWQGIFLFEHRRRPHTREVAVHLIGE